MADNQETDTNDEIQFAFKDSTIITTTDEITALDLKDCIEEKLKNDKFPKRSKLIVFAGYHGDKEKGNMGDTDMQFVENFNGVIVALEEKYAEKIEENDYLLSGNVVPIHKNPGQR